MTIGLASFERIRYRQHDGDVFLYTLKSVRLELVMNLKIAKALGL